MRQLKTLPLILAMFVMVGCFEDMTLSQAKKVDAEFSKTLGEAKDKIQAHYEIGSEDLRATIREDIAPVVDKADMAKQEYHALVELWSTVGDKPDGVATKAERFQEIMSKVTLRIAKHLGEDGDE